MSDEARRAALRLTGLGAAVGAAGFFLHLMVLDFFLADPLDLFSMGSFIWVGVGALYGTGVGAAMAWFQAWRRGRRRDRKDRLP
jgi:hypothetical protein